MATITWEVPLTHYPHACSLVLEAAELSAAGVVGDRLEQVKAALLSIPGYPHLRSPEDLVVLVPKAARIWITPATQQQEPTR